MRNLPNNFAAWLEQAIGATTARTVLEALAEGAPVVSVRANIRKGVEATLAADSVPWEPCGIYLPERPLFAADPAWHQGAYYVQDASSMALGEVVRRLVKNYLPADKSLRYLDSCAAPGGKSIAAIDALPAGSFLVANEYDSQRANILAENLAKYGCPDVAVTRGDTKHLSKLGPVFDIIGADVPCSGEGMMRKDATAVEQWSPGLVKQCAATQREILSNIWKCLKPGGFLIYSTCTFNRIENEENVAWLIDEYDAESIDVGLDEYEGVMPSAVAGIHGYRFMPGLVRGEGLFIAVLRKPGELAFSDSRSGKAAGENTVARKSLQALGVDCEGYSVIGNTRVELRPIRHRALCDALSRHPAALRVGLPAAELKGKDYAPLHELALSTLMPSDAPLAELDYTEALAYLRREAPVLQVALPKGYIRVGFEGRPLGWVKNLGNRANNLLPDFLRLRLDPRNLPQNPPQIPLRRI